MKITVIEFAGQGGMAHYAYQLCRGLSAAGANVTLITQEEYELAMLAAPHRVEQRIATKAPRANRRSFTRRMRYLREWMRLRRRVDALRPDVVILGRLHSRLDLLPLFLLRRKGRILIDICHDVDLRDGFIWRRIYRMFDAVFVHYDRNREIFRRTFRLPEDRVGVIVHGNESIFTDLADPTFRADTLRKQLGLGDEEPVVLFFGNLADYKGIDILLHAFARKPPRARLVIAGYPMRNFDLEAHIELAEKLGIAQDVVWVPEYIPSEHVVAWMELASVIVFPYRSISHGGALHVAQTYGVPTIASAVGGTLDVIEDGVSGLLIAPDDVEGFANAIARLLDDRDFAAQLGARFKADAHGRFSWEAIGQTIVERLR